MKTTHVSVRGPLPATGDWTVAVSAASTEFAQRLHDTLELFVRAARAGLLAGAQQAPWEATAEIASPLRAAAGVSATVRCHVVDAGAVRILANLLAAAADAPSGGIELRVADMPARHRNEAMIDAQQVPFPAAHAPTPFALAMAFPEKSAEPITARLEFVGEVIEATADRVWDRLRVWEEVVRSGGFAERLTDASAEPGLKATEGYLLSATRAEFVAYGFWADDAALDGLVNVISRVAVDVQQIASVEIW